MLGKTEDEGKEDDSSWGRKGSDMTQQLNNSNNSTPSKISPNTDKDAVQLKL